MRLKKTAIVVFVGCLIFSVQAQCVVITPSNMVLPTSAGEIFSFDFVVFDAMDTNALAFQVTISVGGPGTLTLDANSSIVVKEEAKYWAFENSSLATVIDHGGNTYTFGDYTKNGLGELLDSNDIMARYAFEWDGTEGAYTFTLDLDTSKSFVQKDDLGIEALEFTPESYPGNNNSFTVNIPEPGTLVIFGTMGLCLKNVVRKHSTLP